QCARLCSPHAAGRCIENVRRRARGVTAQRLRNEYGERPSSEASHARFCWHPEAGMLAWRAVRDGFELTRFVLVCLGGAAGTGARYLVALGAPLLLGPTFPWGTLTVNVV